ncbi:unnamed protein product [Blumeria hordei]|uniref:Translation initiation factor IF2/IF5 domain-containing protein n=2 Tax=Blumeria hordei TaxID=2867405 RepID=A0A383UTG9_BLUHO|nr:eukaryotic translation initiation factor 2 beta subunit [Blumeria hordei DH14]SZF02630.1 unnamed protein product [Blumeria hordei]
MADTESIPQEKMSTKAVTIGENFQDDAKDSTSATNNEREQAEPSLSIEDPEKNAAGEDDVTNMLKGMRKKKKVKKPVDEDEIAAPVEDGGLDLSAMKKKKKSKKPKDLPEDEFAAKIAALEIENKEGNVSTGVTEVDGDMEQGTGVWQHNSEVKIPYDQLLSRFFILLAQKNPDHLSSGSKSYKIPPPQCLREGNKKTIFANIAEICKRMKRTDEHVTSYLFAELGTSGSVDGSRRLVIKGRFQQKQIENVLRRYIMEYVTCKTCRSPDTELNKGENRLYFITCNSCGSRRSVTAIKTGFSAQVGKRRRQQG